MAPFDLGEEFKQVKHEIGRFFSRISGSFGNFKKPSTELSQTFDSFCVKVTLPGVLKKEIALDIDTTSLQILVDKKSSKTFNGYYRLISLPEDLDIAFAKARLRRNVLEIIIPKKKLPK